METGLEIQLVGHACLIIKYKNTSILLDPWFGFPFNFGAFHAVPPFGPPDQATIDAIDAIHISHLHSDHFCAQSLSYFKRETPIFISRHRDGVFADHVRRLGFTDIREVDHGIAGVKFKDLQLHSFIATRTYPYDSALVVKADDETFLFENDASFSPLHYLVLSRYFPNMKGVCTGYSDIFPFPTCFDFSECENIGGPDFKECFQIFSEERAWKNVESICDALRPSWIFPYASGLGFRNADLIHHNDIFLDVRKVFSRDLGKTRPIVLRPGDRIVNEHIDTSKYVAEELPTLPALIDRTVTAQEVENQSAKLIEVYIDSLQGEISKWTTPMTIRLGVHDANGDRFKIGFKFDGQELRVHESDQYDLEIDYPADCIIKLLEKTWSMRILHHTYRYSVKVRRVVDAQIAVHNWGG